MVTIETRTRAQEPAPGPDQSHPAPNRAGGKDPPPGLINSQPAAEMLPLYDGDWACFQAHCAGAGTRALPASPELVAAFLAASGAGRAALARRLAAIDHQHRQLGYPPPGLDVGVRAALRQGRRSYGSGVLQCTGSALMAPKEFGPRSKSSATKSLVPRHTLGYEPCGSIGGLSLAT